MSDITIGFLGVLVFLGWIAYLASTPKEDNREKNSEKHC